VKNVPGGFSGYFTDTMAETERKSTQQQDNMSSLAAFLAPACL
jgi:hypothetical protein